MAEYAEKIKPTISNSVEIEEGEPTE